MKVTHNDVIDVVLKEGIREVINEILKEIFIANAASLILDGIVVRNVRALV